jgi:hypothetical protein
LTEASQDLEDSKKTAGQDIFSTLPEYFVAFVVTGFVCSLDFPREGDHFPVAVKPLFLLAALGSY